MASLLNLRRIKLHHIDQRMEIMAMGRKLTSQLKIRQIRLHHPDQSDIQHDLDIRTPTRHGASIPKKNPSCNHRLHRHQVTLSSSQLHQSSGWRTNCQANQSPRQRSRSINRQHRLWIKQILLRELHYSLQSAG